jgi:uncharacterized membrane protein HdeD (DUF308 family)
MEIMKYVAYVVGSLFIVMGIAILSNYFMKGVPDQLRIMFGIVIILYGIFRIVTTIFKKNTTSGM